jgi:hypothetical protein
MALVVTFVTIAALSILGVMLRRPESDRGWRDEVAGLGERVELKVFPRTSYKLRRADTDVEEKKFCWRDFCQALVDETYFASLGDAGSGRRPYRSGIRRMLGILDVLWEPLAALSEE